MLVANQVNVGRTVMRRGKITDGAETLGGLLMYDVAAKIKTMAALVGIIQPDVTATTRGHGGQPGAGHRVAVAHKMSLCTIHDGFVYKKENYQLVDQNKQQHFRH